VAIAARAAAAELSGQLGQPALEVDVEVALFATAGNAEGEARPARFVDPVAIAGLVVALAQLGYQVYTDQKKKHGRKPSHESVTREIRVRQWESGEVPKPQQRVLDVVIREVIKAADAEDDE
jgi:uncharacterized membrane protein YebE (DUF533 family)